MKKNILVPTDFSKNAWNALGYAMTLYKDTPCTFYILNAFQPDHSSPERFVKLKLGGKAYEQAKEESEHGLARLLKGISFRTENPGHQFKTIASYNDVLDAIQENIDTHDIDLVVMGNKSEHAPLVNSYGKHTADAMEKVEKCPVLVVPDNIVLLENSVEEIVFTTNYKFPFKRRELDTLIHLSNRFNAAIRILYIEGEIKNFSKEQEKNRDVLRDYLAETRFSFHTLTKVTVPVGIHSFIESRDSDFLALYKRKKGFFSKLFSETLAEDIDFNPKVPVLILKELP